MFCLSYRANLLDDSLFCRMWKTIKRGIKQRRPGKTDVPVVSLARRAAACIPTLCVSLLCWLQRIRAWTDGFRPEGAV